MRFMSAGYARGRTLRNFVMLIVASFACSSVVLTGCARPHLRTATAAFADSQERTRIDELLNRIQSADTKEDLTGVLACYTPEVTWFPPDGSAVYGIDLIRARYQQLFAENDLDVTIRAEDMQIGRSVASVAGSTLVHRAPRSGGPPVTSQDRFIMLVRKSEAGWRVQVLAWWPDEPTK
jgi:ketosteroid isomerase-like protein